MNIEDMGVCNGNRNFIIYGREDLLSKDSKVYITICRIVDDILRYTNKKNNPQAVRVRASAH